jgi:hypothetical protein
MTAATALIAELHGLGVSVSVGGGNLHLRPKARVTADMVDRVRQHKAEVVRAIRLDRLAALDDNHRDAWEERLAIGTIDGGLSEADAEEVAWREMKCSEYDKKSENRLHTDGEKC